MPTKIIMGNNCIEANKETIKNYGLNAMIVTGKSSAKKCGALDDITKTLAANGQHYFIYDKVMSNPTVDCVYEGAELARKNKTDFVIAIGGGSPMDAAKAIALLAKQNIDKNDIFTVEYDDNALPLIHIPTTAGTGSEVTPYAVLTNDINATKTSVSSPCMFPKIAFLDGKYMLTLERTTTVNTAIDALSHAIEGMLSVRADAMSDVLAKESIRIICECIPSLLNFSLSLEQRNSLLYASTLAGIVIAQTGTVTVHVLGYSLTYFKNIDHGRANGLLLAEFLKTVEKVYPDKIAEIIRCTGYSSVDELKKILDTLLGEKEKLTKAEIEKFSADSIKLKHIKNCIFKATEQDLINIYTKSIG